MLKPVHFKLIGGVESLHQQIRKSAFDKKVLGNENLSITCDIMKEKVFKSENQGLYILKKSLTVNLKFIIILKFPMI